MKRQLARLIALGLLVVTVSACGRRMTPERVADQYIQSLQTQNFKGFRDLFHPARRDPITEVMFRSLKVSDIRVLGVKPPYIDVAYTLTMGQEVFQEAGSIYLHPDFSIKYEPIFMPHLALALRGFLEQMRSHDPAQRLSADQTLQTWGVSDFGYDPDSTMDEQERAADQFEIWLNDKGPTFDLGDVKIPLSSLDKERL